MKYDSAVKHGALYLLAKKGVPDIRWGETGNSQTSVSASSDAWLSAGSQPFDRGGIYMVWLAPRKLEKSATSELTVDTGTL